MQTGYLEAGTAGIAVPVRGRGDQVVAGLGVITPAGDPAARAGAIVQALHTSARHPPDPAGRPLRRAAAPAPGHTAPVASSIPFNGTTVVPPTGR